jgi:hypothetical protein
VPTITVASDFDGPGADGKAYRHKFSGKYSHRILEGIGHNVPQEAPQAFAQAIVDVDSERPKTHTLAVAIAGDDACNDLALFSAINDMATKAYREGNLPFPNGAIIVRLVFIHYAP